MAAIVTAVIGLLVAVAILYLVRRDKLHVNHALGWICVALSCALLGFAPGGFDYIAARLGIGYPPVLALTIGIGLLVVKILTMDIERSRSTMQMQRLIQRVAILDAEIQDLKKTHKQPAETEPGNR